MFEDDASRRYGRAAQAIDVAGIPSTVGGATRVVAAPKSDTSWLRARIGLRQAILVTTFVGIGSAVACLAVLEARGPANANDLHHHVRIAEVQAIQTVLSAEETLGLRAPPPTPIEVQAIDAPWAPAAADAKPWTPEPYAPAPLAITEPGGPK